MSVFNPEIAARALIPKTLLGQASSLHLAIHINKTLVSVSLAEAAGGDFHWSEDFMLEDTRDNWDAALNFISARNWWEKVFRKCTISFDTHEFTLVPSAFFQKEKERELLEFNIGKIAGGIESLEIPELDAVMIYAIESKIKDLALQFPNARIFPSAFLFAKYASAQTERNEKALYIYHAPGMMLLVALNGKKLLLLNHYQVNNDEDILYHTANACLRLDLDMENVKLQLCELQKKEHLENLFRHYNRNLSHAPLPIAGSDKQNTSIISQMHVLCA